MNVDDGGMIDTCAVWDRLAAFWDEHLKEGNAFQKRLIMPTTDALLGDVAGKRVLDACCGNGNYARHLASRGATVVAFDGSTVFIDCARRRTDQKSDIAYHVINATDLPALLTLGKSRFDAIVCSMAFMDLADIDPILTAGRQLLVPGGCFVFSVCHPAFNSPRNINTAELVNDNGKLRQQFGVKTEFYLTAYQDASEGMINQPEPHPMFHRSISQLFGHCFNAGFVIDAVKEPAFSWDKSANAFSFARRPEIPPALVVRLR